ncbi:MAG: RNA polymerase sigma factor, partial [Gammaproteobacteria bacterium]
MNNTKLNKATENLYREYKDHVFSYLYRLSSNYEIALDLTQQTFLKILNDKNILSLKSPKAYLFTVARNTLYNEWKKKKEFQLSDEDQAEQIPDEQTAIPDDDASKQDLKNKIESAIKSLPEKSRELMLLHYSDGLSYQEIVSVTGRKLSDVKVNLHRARHRFESVMTTQMYRKIAASREQCDEILTLLTPFKNNEIPESQIDIIDAHITSCNICSDDAQQMKRTRQLFSILPLFLAPSILDQMFNQSFGVSIASSGASVGDATNTANSIATGTAKITATKLIASVAVVAILATAGFLILKKDKLPDNVNSPATPSTTIASNAKSQQSTTQAKSYNSNTDASLETPKKVFAGSTFKVKWTGPNNDSDIIAVFDKTNPKHSYNYQYANSKSPSKLVAPETPGVYEVIYKTTKGKILVKIPLTVVSAGIKFQTLQSVTAGSKFNVAWSGASNHTDAVSVFNKIKPDLTFNSVYAFSNSSAKLTAPEMPGQYEVLYKTPQGRILSRIPLTVIS